MMNTLSLNEKRIIVEKHEESFIRFLRDGLPANPGRVSQLFQVHGGIFHCSTLDVRRRGEFQSYFA